MGSKRGAMSEEWEVQLVSKGREFVCEARVVLFEIRYVSAHLQKRARNDATAEFEELQCTNCISASIESHSGSH